MATPWGDLVVAFAALAWALPSPLDVGAWVLPGLYFLLIFGGQGAFVLLGLRMPSLRPGELLEGRAEAGVSVIIPARNEREDLPHCLDDLAQQDLPRFGGHLEVLVVDDHSEDGTGALAEQHPLRPRVIRPPPLPAGWMGKTWACHTGVAQAREAHLLFLDADVRLAPQAVRAAVVRQRETGADLVTFASRIVMEGFWERVVLPLLGQLVLLTYRSPWTNVDASPHAMANGQFLFFTRAGYARSGGHERVRGAFLEDIRLAQELKRAGGKVRIFWAPELLQTRMYADRHEMSEGILKILYGPRFSRARLLALAGVVFALFLTPFLVLGAALLGLLGAVWLLASLLLILLTALKQMALQRALAAPRSYGLLYPLASLYYLGLFGRAIRRGRRNIPWKGRSYDLGE